MELIKLVLLTLSSGFRSFSMFLNNGIYHFCPAYIDIVRVIFQVGFNCKYREHINTYEFAFLVCEPRVTILLNF
jgi:hypothetical protein